MNRKLLFYWTSVLLLSGVMGASLFLRAPHVSSNEAFAILLLSILAIIAESLGFVLPNSARGSIAFIPYLASALVVPSWPTVVGVILVKTITELTRRGKLGLMLLNVALHVLTVSGAIWVYLLLGGRGLLTASTSSLLLATLSWSIP